MNKQAFTLVELIVVITILAILGTIAFISLQGYSRDARDSVRQSDIANINSSLTLFETQRGIYPEPTGGVDITFSGGQVWNQGTIGLSVITNLDQLNGKPVDPLTEVEYTYSRLNTKKEVELAAVLEGGVSQATSIINQANAAGTLVGTTYIKGNYNGIVAKVSTGSTQYILAVPTIISGNILLTDIILLIQSNGLAINGSQKLPSSYTGTTFGSDNTSVDYSPTNIVVYTGSISSLSNSDNQVILLNNLKTVYENTSIINTNDDVAKIVNTIVSNPDNTMKILASAIVKKGIDPSVVLYNPVPPKPFISKWDVGLGAGTSGLSNLKFPLQSNGTYNFTIDWGDGLPIDTITTWDQAEITHTYAPVGPGPGAGVYTVTIVGTIDGFKVTSDAIKLVDIVQWGDVKISDGGQQFAYTSNLLGFSAIDEPDLSNVKDISYMFFFSSIFNGDIGGWDTSNITSMSGVFFLATYFNQNIGNWDTSSVTNMGLLFRSATSFNQDISKWDVSKVTNMGDMFHLAESFNQDISGWKTNSLNYTGDMFIDALLFNQDISKWDVSKVTNMGHMFKRATSFNQDISGWDTSKVTSMDLMFNGATSFNQDLSLWDFTSIPTPTHVDFDLGTTSWVLPRPIW